MGCRAVIGKLILLFEWDFVGLTLYCYLHTENLVRLGYLGVAQLRVA